MASRTTREILEDHLQRRASGDLEGDLANNYAEDIVLLCRHGVFLGCDAIRESADVLGLQLPNARFDYLSCQIHGENGFLEWRADSDTTIVEDGADSYVIRDGRIRVQTIHYTPLAKG